MAERKLKIAISIWSFTPNTGGLQAHAQSLCKHLIARGHEVVVVTRSATKIPSGGDYLFYNEPVEEIRINGIPVRFLRFPLCWRPLLWVILKLHAQPAFSGLAALLFQRIAAKPAKEAFAGFHLIHHVGHATALVGFAAASAAKHNRVPFLVQPTAHPHHFGDTKLDFRLYRTANRILVHTNYEKQYFLANGINCPIDVVYNGIEDRSDGVAERFRKKYGIEGPIILYLGRKAIDKGYPLVIEAFKMITAKFHGVSLVCIGPDSLDVKVVPVPGVLELKFVNEDEKHDALAACSFLCVPSEGESFGLVFMEAGRYGKAVIARGVPVLEELFGDKRALLLGRQRPNANSADLEPSELAAGLELLLNNEALRTDIGESCRQVSELYLWDIVAEKFENAYKSATF